MKDNTLDIKTVCECNRCLGCKTLHPQVSIINLENPNVYQDAVKFEFYTFFFYRKEEALHLSQRETAKVTCCLENIEDELHHSIDAHSNTILSRHIELLLDYCLRYYERQFITRENKNKMILEKLERILDGYITSGKLQEGKLPS